MQVPLLDLKAQYATIRDEINVAVDEVLESQSFILGPTVEKFEEEIAQYCRTKYAIDVASGTDALFLEHSYFYVLLSTGWDAVLRAFGLRIGYKDYYLDLYSDTSQGWKDCQAALKELIRLCQEKHIELRIAIIPELHQPDETYALGKIHTLISSIGSQHNIPVIDLLPAFKGIDPQSLWVSPGDPHANEKAHLLIAKAIYMADVTSAVGWPSR